MVDTRKIRKSICEIARLIYEKELTDLMGGNYSVRDGNMIYINERLSGPRFQWEVDEDSIIVTDICKIPVIGDVNMVTREANTHYMIYQKFPDVKAIIHCHPLFPVVFASAHMPIPSVTEGARVIFGDQPVTPIDETVPSSKIQAERVTENFENRRKIDKNTPLICTVPFHGVFAAGKDLNEALVFVDALNNCAQMLIYRQLMFGNNPEADLSIRTHFKREDFDTMNDFKEVAEPGYRYKDAFGNETVYNGYKPGEAKYGIFNK